MIPIIALLGVATSSASATDLRCEYLVEPICIDSSAPRLSWVDDAPTRGWRQSAYQILVASTPQTLDRDQGDLWDSGKVDSRESIQIPYGGTRLRSRQACYWKVRVWDLADRKTSWSSIRHWEMGLLAPAEWFGAEWIGRHAPAQANPAPYLRREFSIDGPIARARVYACGLGYADISLNGRPAKPKSERDPAYTNYDKRALYVAYDVTRRLKPGKNAIGAILGTGWYDVHDIATWHFERAPWRDRPKLKLLLAIDYRDGRSQVVVTDRTWRSTTGPILSDGIYTGELYDARREIPNWDRSGFDDRKWTLAEEMAAPKGILTAMKCPPLSVTESFRSVSTKEPRTGVYVVDFGQNLAGHVRLHFSAPAGTRITMRYSERVGKDGMITRGEIEQFMAKATPPQPFQTDTYICRGGGNETWEGRFSYSGFRYMEVTGLATAPTAQNFTAQFAHTDLASAGDFSCSSDLLNRIQRATRYSYFSNAQSIPTDCPQREKNGWTGDAQLAAEAGLMNFHAAPFYSKWLDDFGDTESPDGRVSIIVPTGGWGFGDRNPAWDSAYPIIAEDLYQYSGDLRIFETHYANLARYVDSLASQTEDGYVPFDSLGDWVPWNTQTPSQLTSTAYLYADALIVARAARRLGKPADAQKFDALGERVRAAFNRHFFHMKTDQFDQGSQTANAMALYFGLVPESHRAAVFGSLVENITRQGHIDTGILGAKYVLRVLSEGGRTDLAYQLVTRQAPPSWGAWIRQGATTLWEDWKGESSLNHIMFGDVSNWFFQWVAGIGLDPTSAGFSHILIRPQPVADLTWARATYDSPHGRIVSSWRKEGSRFTLDVTIPPNTSATVRIPATGPITESGRPIQEIEGTTLGPTVEGATIIEVGSGTYRFRAKA